MIMSISVHLSLSSAKHHCFQLGFYSNNYFINGGELIHRLNLEDQCASFSLAFDLSGKRDPTNYTTTDIALRFLKIHKLLHPIDIFSEVVVLWRGKFYIYIIFHISRSEHTKARIWNEGMYM